MRTMLLVHGAWHGSWCWAPVTAHLAARGVPSVAVDLLGHGLNGSAPAARWARPFDPAAFAAAPSPVAGITTDAAAGALVDQIRLVGGGEPCVVVAHSVGGVIATAAAELAPDLFAHLVYVSAYVPITASVAELFTSSEAAGELVSGLFVADPAAIGALRHDPGDPERRKGLREALYGDVDVTTADAAIALLDTESPVHFPAEKVAVTRGRYGGVPHTYVVCAKDRAIPEPLQRRFVRDVDAVSSAATRVIALDTSHSPFLSRPEELAQAVTTAW
ncbi:alpha/beta fold hydrolase [Actinacidiphila oryziradicis]|uniref:Alpha/beta hydrolase n=1 Tax=Actinacidiphila oryziradicis TaxID=2571141 RepID=A0A4U0S071_9ACTN|nr:alpha/beta fold hydrolase [Actinacidiphila oryziradicis]TKA02140.1 alpha/beta hydrolase [Actinacidiphila oryziradicis]